jgi:8-oxo-dGTP diphosphatase
MKSNVAVKQHHSLTQTPFLRLTGTLQFPGGHLEKTETFFYCAEREALEETGLEVVGREVLGVTNDVFKEGKHYVTIFVLCEVKDAEKEPVVRPFCERN